MSLFGRIAWTGLALLGIAALLALLVWKPVSQRAFVARTEGMLRNAERDFEAIATSRVEKTMEFAAEAALGADERRTLAIADLPLVLYTDAEGRVEPERLHDGMRAAVANPDAAGGQKHAAVRAEILARTRREVQERLDDLRHARSVAAARHGELASWRTLAAWGGIVILLLAGWAIALDRVVVRPVREATQAVGRFGAGERGVRLAPHGASELTALAAAFNETAAAVERAETENAELRALLEEKVKERTAALVRAARASTVGTMAGGVAHEFNNLLGGILGCAQAALEDDPKPEVKEAVEMIRKTASRGVGMTKAMLRATRAEPDLAPCDPAALFEEALQEVRPPASVAVHKEFAPVSLEADATMLRQVLGNLIRNAVAVLEGREDCEVHLRIKRGVGGDGKEEILLEVEDSGPGIEPSVRDILFEPFVTTRAGGREGAGLGLFLSERLVAAHGGRLEVGSEPGAGARFVVHLPVRGDAPAPDASARDS